MKPPVKTSKNDKNRCRCGMPAVQVNGEAQNGGWKEIKAVGYSGVPYSKFLFVCNNCLEAAGFELPTPQYVGKTDIIPGK